MSTQTVCPNCNQPIISDQNYCPNCGRVLQLQAKIPPGQLVGTIPDVFKQYDTIAGTITTISGVLASLYAAGIFAGKIMTGILFNAIIYVLPLALLLGAIISAVMVFYPRGYLGDVTFGQIIDKKERRLLFSIGFFSAAVVVLIGGLFAYLIRPV